MLAAPPPQTVGRSVAGRPIAARVLATPKVRRTVLVVGCVHGNECAGAAVVRRLATGRPVSGAALWLVPTLNPDGRARGTRQNGHGVDLNRNFGAGWRARGRPWDPEYPGPRPFSEPETRAARALVRRLRPDVTIWFHQPQGLVRAWGRSVAAARRFARAAGLPFRRLEWPAGAATRWQNAHRLGVAFVVELPPGRLSAGAARREAAAVRTLARPPGSL